MPRWARLGFSSEREYRAFRQSPEFKRSLGREQRGARRGATRRGIEIRAAERVGRKEWPRSKRHSHRNRRVWQIVVLIEWDDNTSQTLALEFDHAPSLDEVERAFEDAYAEHYERFAYLKSWRIIGEVELVP